MLRRIGMAVIGVLAASFLTAGAAGTEVDVGYGTRQLQRDLDAVRAAGAPGVLARVEHGHRVVRGVSGVSNLDSGAPVDPDGNFRMGSNTKTFLAVAVLQLVAERRIGLDDTVARWLPGVVPRGDRITLRQLLQHTSGLHNYTDDLLTGITSDEQYRRDVQFRTFRTEELVAGAVSQPPDFAPGQGWNYSNTNYLLLGMIVGRVTGRAWSTVVADRILRPLGLRHTYAPGLATVLPRPRSTGYFTLTAGPLDVTDHSMTWAGSAGALVTNAADLARFWGALGRLLPPAQRRAMRTTVLATTFQADEPGYRYGLGLGWKPLTCGGGYWLHGGDVPGYSTFAGVSEDGRTRVVIAVSALADLRTHEAAWTLTDHAMCANRR